MKYLFFILLINVLFIACDNEDYTPNIFYYNFESVRNDSIDLITDFYEDMNITFVLKSYMVFDYKDLYNSEFVKIIDNTKVLTCDRDIYLPNDTLIKKTNLFNDNSDSLIKFEISLLKSIPQKCYLIRINPKKLNLSQANSGFYKFYFNAISIDNEKICDSTIIKNTTSANKQ